MGAFCRPGLKTSKHSLYGDGSEFRVRFAGIVACRKGCWRRLRGKRIFREPQITGSPVWAGFRKQTFVELMEGAESGAMNRPGVCEAGWSAVRLWPLNTGGFGVAESVPLLLPLY